MLRFHDKRWGPSSDRHGRRSTMVVFAAAGDPLGGQSTTSAPPLTTLEISCCASVAPDREIDIGRTRWHWFGHA